MDKLKVFGKADLNGSIKIPGAKNAVLPIMACSILSNQSLHLTNVPNLVDIMTMKKLLKNFGLVFHSHKNSLSVIANNISNQVADLYAENDGYTRSFQSLRPDEFGGNDLYSGSGLYARGRGLYASAQKDIRGRGKGDMMGNGNKVNPRVLTSQAKDANFHFRFTLPLKYQQK